MADIEKVIKGIDICLQRFRCGEDCPYYNTEKIGCMEQLREDALELLKEYAVIKKNISNEIHETAKMFRRTEENGWIERCDRRARQSLSD